MSEQEQDAAFEAGGPPTWGQCATSLGLTGGQDERILSLVNGYKSAFTEIVSRPAVGNEPSPLTRMAEKLHASMDAGLPLHEQPLALHGAFSVFTAYCAEAAPEGEAANYADLLERCRVQFTGEIEALLDKRQRALFRVSVAPHMLDIKTGHDPFGEAIGQWVRPAADPAPTGPQEGRSSDEAAAAYSPWEVIARVNQSAETSEFSILAQALSLDAEQQGRFRSELNRLKDAVAGLMALEDADGASPARILARALAQHGGRETPQLKQDFMHYLGTARPQGDAATFRERFVALEEATHAGLRAFLSQEQRAAFRLVSPGTLPEIRTGYDPVGPVVRAALETSEGASGPEGHTGDMLWADFAARLALDEAQGSELHGLIARLHEEFRLLHAAPAAKDGPAPLAVLEAAQRESADPAEAMARFRDYAASARHHLLGRPYTEVFAGIEAQTRGRIARLLRPDQARLLAALPLGSLVQVSLDGPTAAAEAPDPRTSTPAAALRRHANALKDEALALYRQPPEGGGAAPFAILCDGLRQGDARAEARFQAELRTRKPAGAARTYAQELAEREARKKADFLAEAPPGARETWRKALPPLLLSLETGYNPLLAQLRQELGAGAPGTPAP